MKERIHDLVLKYREEILNNRAYIHAHPELSGEEKNTSAFVASKLKEMGLEPVEHIGGYGVTALIRGKEEGKCLGLRADMDALPVREETGVSFCSLEEGVSHACGHDTHTAMLLGAARILCEMKDELHGSIKLIFQPEEENVLNPGAPRMIKDGVLEDPHVDAMIAQHMSPLYETGTVGVSDGMAMASSDRFKITLYGKKCHAAQPQNGIDAIIMASQVVMALQTIVSRNVRPQDASVLTIGTLQAGDRYNVVAGKAVLEGTCRNLNREIAATMPERIENIVKGIAEAMGGTYEMYYHHGYKPSMNDEKMTSLVKNVQKDILGEDRVLTIPAQMTGEDFSYFAEEVPSVFYWVGCRDPKVDVKDAAPLHNGGMLPQEEAVIKGVELLVNEAIAYLNQ